MRILKVYPFPDVKAGTEITMHVGTDVLREMGHTVFLAHGQPKTPETAVRYDGEFSIPAVFDRNSKVRPAGYAQDMAKLDAFVRDNKIDLLHLHTYPRTEAIGEWASRYPVVVGIYVPLCPNGMRYLWTDRCVCERDIGLGCLTVGYREKGCGHLGNGLPMGLPGFVRGMFEDYRLRRDIGLVARIITNSNWMVERLVKDGLPRERLRVLNSPIEMTGSPDQDFREMLVDPPAILWVGRMVDFKGADHVLRASKEMTVPHQLWFAGDGSSRAETEQLAKELGITERVRFFGELKARDIDPLRKQCSVVVVPSLWPEPFGRVGPEAMMIQRPVVAYAVGGVPEWLENGVTGYTVEPGNYQALAKVLTDLLTNPEKAKQMGRAGLEMCARWVPERHGEILAEIYQEALAAGPSKRA